MGVPQTSRRKFIFKSSDQQFNGQFELLEKLTMVSWNSPQINSAFLTAAWCADSQLDDFVHFRAMIYVRLSVVWGNVTYTYADRIADTIYLPIERENLSNYHERGACGKIPPR